MPKVIIDGTEYDLDTMSENAKTQVNNIHFVDTEILRLQNSIAIFQTAKASYLHVLKQELGTIPR